MGALTPISCYYKILFMNPVLAVVSAAFITTGYLIRLFHRSAGEANSDQVE
jgi:hypothetical protein